MRDRLRRGAVAVAAQPARPYHHVVTTGQSLSEGTNGTPVLSTTPAATARMFRGGILRPSGAANGLASVIPLLASGVESLHSSFSAWLEASEPGHHLLVSCYGRGGYSYADLKKGEIDYTGLIASVTAGHALGDASGRPHSVGAVLNVHGENDHLEGTENYASCLAEWQSDLETDIAAITAQSGDIPFLLTQMSSWTHYDDTTSLIPYAQLAAALASEGKIVCVGPKYFLPYSDGLHLTNVGYRWMGELYAKVYQAVVCRGASWLPLYPTSVTRTRRVITAVFNVPVEPLVIDVTVVSDPGAYGFEFYDSSGSPPAISSVELAGPATVQITLAAQPTGGSQRLRYAYTGTAGAAAGPTTGARGCLRDSDATASLYGYSLANWCVHFDYEVVSLGTEQ